MRLHKDVLALDLAATADQLVVRLRHDIYHTLRRKGAVVGISGGVDSSVVLALCVRGLGPTELRNYIAVQCSPHLPPLT